MKLKIALFGIAKEIVGSSQLELEAPERQSVADLIAQLRAQYPALNALTSFAVAVNSEYAPEDYCLRENDEIALIPPVSGG
ncbi:molybdopterin synthase sulfur carrier subunit [Hymenobacter daecheongensis DSM 21074]|uniref:Molybdopterin synthase sulfur carrier subunit n=1 Tax=Hymenobacter daecheongensis DSM 21074 TaxID=1121955 RepID=A0A1M6AP39_9BACT|nr:MoaD/ThiS family protein [Hymenobacter daecheongensis]SHI38232.1 molybdopterin synthase sulfur carrier subunit [Hymenobacter daecheongensis DSM 21074]